jgi:hypothetical protein
MAGYIGTTPVPQATQHRESFTATGGQTSFATAGYTPQFIDVYLNGVKLAPADYTATNGSDVVLASGATASDILEIVAYTPFEVANQTFTGDTSVTNLAVTGTFTSRGIDDNADAVAITIDSSENVGIGTTSPSNQLHVNGTSDQLRLSDGVNGFDIRAGVSLIIKDDGTERMRISSDGSVGIGTSSPDGRADIAQDQNTTKFTSPHLALTATDTTDTTGFTGISYASSTLTNYGWTVGALRATSGVNSAFVFTQHNNSASGTERMRIDSSGNLLVGKTASSGSTQGAQLQAAGNVFATASNDYPLYLNRLGSDGQLAQFRKDGTQVGSIGTTGGYLTVTASGGSDAGAKLGNSAIFPCNTDGSDRDAGINLGLSTVRWKDLYLSGGVYLGGTGAANLLDDYEEGTWTPSLESNGQIGSFTYTQQAGFYTKIGRLVHVSCNIAWSAKPSTGGTFRVSGLPFAYNANSYTNDLGVSVGYSTGMPNTDGLYGRPTTTGGGSRTAVGWYSDGSTVINVTTSNTISSSGTIRFGLVYFT